MIIVKRIHCNDDGSVLAPSWGLFNDGIESTISFLKEVMNVNNPITYLKDTETDTLIEMAHVENQIVSSYILDLFDFEAKFKSLFE